MNAPPPWPMVAELRPPLIAWCGLLVGSTMLALSISGLLWRIDAISVGVSVLAAAAVSARFASRFEIRPAFSWRALLPVAPLLALPTLAALTPPHTWDAVAYGAALPRDYARAGRFFYNADYGPFSAFPGHYEAIVTASLATFGRVVPAKLVSVALALGLAIGSVHLSLRMGASRLVAPIAAVLVLSAPALQAATRGVKNDVANAFFQCLALLMIADYATRPRKSLLVLGGFFVGTALATKYSSLQFAACFVPLTIVLVLRSRGPRFGKLRDAAIFCVVALAAALPWYARNLLLLGNPFFPFFNELLGAANGFTAEHAALTRELMGGGVIGRSWESGTTRDFLDKTIAGFGWLPVILSMPGLALVVLRRREASPFFLALVFVSFGALTLLVGYWWPRYFLSLLVLSSALAAMSFSEIGRSLRILPGRSRSLAVGLGLLVLVLVGTSVRRQWAATGTLLKDAFGGSRVEFLSAHVADWQLACWINRNVPLGDRIGLGLNVQPFYYIDRGYFHIHPMTEKGNLQALKTPDEYLRAFRSLGLDWLAFRVWSDESRASEPAAPHIVAFAQRFYRAVRALRQSGRLRLVARVGAVSVYRIEGPLAGGDRPRPPF